jgi:hypothetical protein
MTESALNTLRKRLDRLERESRRLKRATLVVIMGATAALLMGQIAPHRPVKTLEAEEFVLRDSRGQIRASLGTTQGPSATILQIHGDNGKPRTRVTVSSDGTSSLEVMDASDRVRLLLGLRENGSPRIWLGNEVGKIIWRAP